MTECGAIPSHFPAGAGPAAADVPRARDGFAWLRRAVAGGPSACLAPLRRVALTQKQRGGWCGWGWRSVVGSGSEAEAR